MLELRDATIGFGDKTLIHSINECFAAGTISTIQKRGVLDGGSALMQCCAGLLPLLEGEVLLNGEPIQQLSRRRLFQSLCYCHEKGGLVSLFSVYNNLALPLTYHDLYPAEEMRERIHRIARQLQFEALLESEPFQLNDVQTRLVNLARAIIVDAKVILLDELQTGMSVDMLQEIIAVLEQLAAAGKVILMVTTTGDSDHFAQQRFVIHQQKLERIS